MEEMFFISDILTGCLLFQGVVLKACFMKKVPCSISAKGFVVERGFESGKNNG